MCRYTGEGNFTLDLFHANYEFFKVVSLSKTETLVNVEESFEIEKEGIYSMFITYCSAVPLPDLSSNED